MTKNKVSKKRRPRISRTEKSVSQKISVYIFTNGKKCDKINRSFGSVAQLVRVPASHAGGPGFEPRRVHQKNPRVYVALGFFILPQFRSLFVTCYEQLFYEKARLLVRQADRFYCTIFSPC